MEQKGMCYLCKGCGIGEALNFEELAKTANEEGFKEFKEHEALCSPEGVALIKADVDAGYNALMICACSSREKTDEFSFEGNLIERVPLREMAVYCSEDTYEAEEEPGQFRQMLANDYIRMGAAKLKKCQPPEPFQLEEEVAKAVMVVGGGVAGMTAAIEAAKAGTQVYLVEKEAQLGGFLGKMAKLSPQSPPYQELEDTGLEDMVAELQGNDLVKIFTGTTVEKTEGAPGNFSVTLANGESFRAGAIIQASGWTPYDPENLKDDLAYGSSPDIITNVMMEEMAKEGKIVRKSDGSPVSAVAFIQCSGSRDQNHLPYCSAFCCVVSLKQAIYVKQQNPDATVYVVFKDIRTPGQSEEVYRQAQRAGVTFLRRPEDEYPQISQSGGKLTVEATDMLLGEKVLLGDLDLVVLATGMVPNNPKVVDPPLIPFEVPEEEGKKMTAEALAANEKWSVLNLAYRQSPNMPTLKYKMPDSNFICFPYESRRTGIYATGTVRRPMRVTQAQADATGAALKAIQAIRAAEVGCAVHPRSGDETFPEFAMQRCTQCKRCTEECPFGAINEDEKANPLPNPTRCRRCGVCMGACPERIISFKNYSVDIIGSMIKNIEVPEDEDEMLRIICLICENDALPALDMAARRGIKFNPLVRFIPVRCMGSVNLVWIADSLSSGVDGVMLLGCTRGEDYQCHFARGSELANVRMSKVAETLQRLALESERVRVEQVAINDVEKLPAIINEFVDSVLELGPNPFKGF